MQSGEEKKTAQVHMHRECIWLHSTKKSLLRVLDRLPRDEEAQEVEAPLLEAPKMLIRLLQWEGTADK